MSANASLGNTFVPKIPSSLIARILMQISTQGLINLCSLWSSMTQTKPIPSTKQRKELRVTEEQLLKDFTEYIEKFKKSKNRIKRHLVDKLLVDFYSNGLNLLQFAQLDSQLLVEKPLNFFWKSNKILNSDDQEHVINIYNPQVFLDNLLKDLSQFYLNHIYISRHPNYPLIIIRIQLFDLISDVSYSELRKLSTSSSIVSRKPFFIALPLNSSNIISSYQGTHFDLTSNIVLQSVESAFSQTLSTPLRIDKRQSNEQPIRSLESLHIIKGNSRFAESLGVWTPYADGTIDISPFDDVLNHQVFQEPIKTDDQDDRLVKIAMLRFKGTLDDLKSEKLYEDVNDNQKRRRLFEDRNYDKSKYSSLTPIQNISFEIENEYKHFKPNVKIKLQGMDVFGGLHELCDEGIINAETIPGWLTGEEGMKPGVIRDDIFIERSKAVMTSNDLI